MANLHIAGSTQIDDGYTLSQISNNKVINSSSTNYIKFQDGNMIYWGNTKCTYRNSNYLISEGTFNPAFKSGTTPYVIATINPNSNSLNDTYTTIRAGSSNTNYSVRIGSHQNQFNSSSVAYASFIAIGRWK